MICPEYDNLSHPEKVKLIGEIVHAIQNDSVCFAAAQSVISLAEARGLLDNVTILPENLNES